MKIILLLSFAILLFNANGQNNDKWPSPKYSIELPTENELSDQIRSLQFLQTGEKNEIFITLLSEPHKIYCFHWDR